MINSSVDYKHLPRPTWAEIDIDAILNNINEYKKILGDKPIEVISITDYGRMQGEKVLKWALSKLGEKED